MDVEGKLSGTFGPREAVLSLLIYRNTLMCRRKTNLLLIMERHLVWNARASPGPQCWVRLLWLDGAPLLLLCWTPVLVSECRVFRLRLGQTPGCYTHYLTIGLSQPSGASSTCSFTHLLLSLPENCMWLRLKGVFYYCCAITTTKKNLTRKLDDIS